MPGLFPIRMALAQANIDMGSPDKALRLLAQSVRADPTQVEAYIRLARLYAQQDQHVTAAKYLEQGFAQDFAIRQHPLYAAVRTEVLMAENKIDEAIKLLREAIEVEGVRQRTRRRSPRKGSPNVSPDGLHITLKDRSMVFCTFIKALAAGDLVGEAKQAQEDALAEFTGTPEEVTIIVAGADVAVKRGDVDEALAALGRIPTTSATYVRARLTMGDIYKKHKKDRKSYAQCYTDVCDHQPSVVNFSLLGDAYLSIQEPLLAIEAFENARRLDKSGKVDHNHNLVKKIGRAWVQVHDYEKAIDYYKTAFKRADSIPAATCSDLRRDLARLYLDLRRYQDCIQEIHRHLAVPHDEATVDQVTDRIRSYLLLSEAHQKHHDSRVRHSEEDVAKCPLSQIPGQDAARAGQLIPQSLDALKEAKELAVKALAAVGVVVGKKSGTGDDEDADVMPLKKLAGDVHYQLGCYLEHREHNFDAAVGQYTTALELDEGKEDALMALARLRLARGEIDSCERTLRALLRVNKDHDDADMMLASVMASKAQKALAASSGYSTEEGIPIEATDEFKAVVGHYKEMLDKDPSNFKALGQLLLLLRKTGRLAHLGPKYLEKAANSIAKG
ncbi:Tetratricopeptide repeat protein 21B, partial [Perkinsus olseni]